MAVTSTSSTIRRHDKPYDPSSYISGTQGDNKTNGENNRTRGPHTIVGLTLSSSTKDSFPATLTQTRKNVLSCRLNPACGVGGRQPMTQDESRAHLLSTVLGRHQTGWYHGFARFVDGGDTSPPRTKYIAYSCYSTIRDGGRGKQDGVLDGCVDDIPTGPTEAHHADTTPFIVVATGSANLPAELVAFTL